MGVVTTICPNNGNVCSVGGPSIMCGYCQQDMNAVRKMEGICRGMKKRVEIGKSS